MTTYEARIPTGSQRPGFRIALPSLGWPALILILAAISRLGWLSLIEFKADESAALAMAATIARGQSFPLTGIGSSLGIPNQPFFVYLMALPVLISPDPRLATALIGTLDVAAVLATYLFALRYLDRITATAAALFFAISPWGIIYSRKVWEQDVLPLFVTVCFFALFGALQEGRRHWLLPGLALLTLAIQLHPTGYFLVVPTGWIVLGCLFGDRPFGARTWRWLILGIGVAAILEAPYVIWQVRHGWPLIETFKHLTGDEPSLDFTAARLALSVAAGNGYPTLAKVGDIWWPSEAIIIVLLSGGIGLAIRRALTESSGARRFAAAALLIWLIAPVALQTRHAVPLYPHYFIVLYPAPFILAGTAVSALAGVRGRGVAIGSYLAPLVVVIPVMIAMFTFGDYITALTRGALRSTFGVPLGAQQAWVEEATRRSGGGPIYVGAHDDLAASLDYLSNGRWRIFNDLHGLPLPSGAGPSLLVLAASDSAGVQQAERLFAPTRPETWPLPGGPTLLLYPLDSGLTRNTLDYHLATAAFENQMRLVGFRVTPDPDQGQIWIDLRWHFDGPATAKSPTVFNHLLDRRGETVGQIDGPAFGDLDRRPGEDFVNAFIVRWPRGPGPYTLQIGLYDYPSMKRFHLLNPEPGAPDDAINLITIDSAD